MTQKPDKRRKEERPVVIYSLKDPISHEIFYVGATSMVLNRRLHCHYTSTKAVGKQIADRINAIKEATTTRLIIEEIDCVPYADWKITEEYWIQQFSAWGFELVNVKHVRQKSYVKPEAQYSHLSDEDLEMITRLFNHGDYTKLASMCGVSKERMRVVLGGRKRHKRLSKRYYPIVLDYYKNVAKDVAKWVA